MNNIREALEKFGVATLCTDAFIEYMIKHIPLGGTSYSLLRLLNKSLDDDTYSMQVYSRMIHCIESVLGAIIKNMRNEREFGIYICKDLSDKKTKLVLADYLNYASSKIKNKRGGLSAKIDGVVECINNARNTFVHSGAVVKIKLDREELSLQTFNALIFTVFVEFYVTYKNPTIWQIVPARWCVFRENVRRVKRSVSNVFDIVSGICGEWYQIIRSVISLLWTSAKTALKWCGVVVVAVLIMGCVNFLWESYYGKPFEEATYEEIRSQAPTEWARLHVRRARIAGRMEYAEGKSDVADKIHRRTAEFNKYAASWDEYPNWIEYLLPFIGDVPLLGDLSSKLSWNNALREMPADYDDSGFLIPRYDNPLSSEIYGNNYFCNFITLGYLYGSADERKSEIAKLEKLCKIVKENPNMELCVVYNPNEDKDCKITMEALAVFVKEGLSKRQMKSQEVAVSRGPKLYLRMDKRY